MPIHPAAIVWVGEGALAGQVSGELSSPSGHCGGKGKPASDRGVDRGARQVSIAIQ